jgi:hypothetical protein
VGGQPAYAAAPLAAGSQPPYGAGTYGAAGATPNAYAQAPAATYGAQPNAQAPAASAYGAQSNAQAPAASAYGAANYGVQPAQAPPAYGGQASAYGQQQQPYGQQQYGQQAYPQYGQQPAYGQQTPYGAHAQPPNAYQASQQAAYSDVSHAANAAAGWAVGAASALGGAIEQAVSPLQPNAYGQQQQPYGGQTPYGMPQQQQPQQGAVPYPGAPPYGPPPAAFGPGARVYVQWADGNKYPATVTQSSGNQCLVMFPDGQQRWVEMQYLTTGM